MAKKTKKTGKKIVVKTQGQVIIQNARTVNPNPPPVPVPNPPPVG